MAFDGVKKSKALQAFYLNKNTEIEMFILFEHLNYQTFIDAGAYFGYFSIYAKKLKPDANVAAYEADIDNFNSLRHYIKVNNVTIDAENLAVGDEYGEVEFYKPAYSGTTSYPTHGQIGDPNDEKENLYKGKKHIRRSVKMIPLEDIVLAP